MDVFIVIDSMATNPKDLAASVEIFNTINEAEYWIKCYINKYGGDPDDWIIVNKERIP